MFKCLAHELNKPSHADARSEIVDYITENRNSDNMFNVNYKHLVENVLEIKSCRHYSKYMSRRGIFATEV